MTKNINIVLVEPRSAGNIGSVARAMKNTGFNGLVLVNPVDYTKDEATLDEAFSMACKAGDVLNGAEVFTDLKGALEGSGLVAGATRRKGKLRTPLLTLDEAAVEILNFSKENRISILFGREDKGLKNEELKLCDILFEIPSDEGYPSTRATPLLTSPTRSLPFATGSLPLRPPRNHHLRSPRGRLSKICTCTLKAPSGPWVTARRTRSIFSLA
jgi:TrmH family RNA methyltransferase